KWTPELTAYFKDRHVVILPDAEDDPGRKHGQKVARALDGVAASVKVVDLFTDRQDGSDVSDWLEQDRAGARLVQKAKETSEWEPPATERPADQKETGAGKSAEALKQSAAEIIKHENRLDLFAGAVAKVVAGETTNAKMLYLVATSRLLNRTM